MFTTGIAGVNVLKTHCPAGHPYDRKNTYRDPRGSRRCRACNRAAVRRYQAKKSSPNRMALIRQEAKQGTTSEVSGEVVNGRPEHRSNRPRRLDVQAEQAHGPIDTGRDESA